MNKKYNSIVKQALSIDLKHEKNCFISANASNIYEIKRAILNKSHGIGLLRLEEIYLNKHDLPSENKLYNILKKLIMPIEKELPVIIRLLDLGGDKLLPYLDMQLGSDSLLGLRGIRVLVKYPNLLETQLKALVRLSVLRPIKILIPMISLPWEIDFVREKIKEIESISKFNCKPKILLGTMIEVPAAVTQIEKIVSLSDFISIGTNDLIQYSMAAGRETVSVGDYYEQGKNVVLTMIKKVIDAAKKKNIICSLCGEMAADKEMIPQLLDIGLKHFSVSAMSIPEVKITIAKHLGIIV